jgi:hypothetical protein
LPREIFVASSKQGEIIQMARQLGSLEERRKQLAEQLKQTDEAIRTLRIRLGTSTDSAGAQGRGDVLDAVLQHLISSPDREFTAEQVAEATGKPAASVRGALSRLFNEQRISRPGRGSYKAKADT